MWIDEGGYDLQVKLYTPQGRQVIGPDISPYLQSCRMTDERPGGFAALSVALATGFIPGDFWRPFSHVEVLINGIVVWEGRVTQPSYDRRWLIGFGAVGYYFTALEDEPYESSDTTLTTSGALLRDVLIDAAPSVVVGASYEVSDPAGTHAPVEFDGMTPKAIIEQLISEGTAEGAQIDPFIREGKRFTLTDRATPRRATYYLALDDPGLTREPRDGDLWGRVRVEYTAYASGTVTMLSGAQTVAVAHDLGIVPSANQITTTPDVTDFVPHFTDMDATGFIIDISGNTAPSDIVWSWSVSIPDQLTDWSAPRGFTDRYVITRRKRIDGGQLSTAAAVQLRDTLADLYNRRTFATSVSRAGYQGLPGPGGAQRVPFYLTRSDGWVWVENDPLPLPIVRVEVDAISGDLTVACDAEAETFATILQRQERDLKRIRERRRPNTAAREGR